MKIKILFEDKNILAIDKPAGIAVHPSDKNVDDKKKELTIVDWVLKTYPNIKDVGDTITDEDGNNKLKTARSGIVHRLDKETSGVLLIAKNQKSFEFLKEQFQNHTIRKVYRAFVYGSVTDPKASLATGGRGVIDVPIGRSPKDIRMWTAGRGARSQLRDAVTEYIVLNRFSDKDTEKPDVNHQFSYVEVYPKTGRTHQIRVHMRYINHPIVSDPLYRGDKEMALGMDRLALHACSITFRTLNGELKTIESPLPTDFKKAVKTYIK